MINAATQRMIFRWIHIVLAIPIIGYVYSPFENLPGYAPVVRFITIPVLVLTGLWMWKGHWLRRLFSKKTGEYIFVDCSAESPKGRRSLCYDRPAWESRKEHKPESDAVTVAAGMGIEILTEEEYRDLQELGEFDLKTSSWVKTPPEIRS